MLGSYLVYHKATKVGALKGQIQQQKSGQMTRDLTRLYAQIT